MPLILVFTTALGGRGALAQSLNEQLDQDRFLRGLSEYGLHDLLDYALESSGKNDAALPSLIEIAHLQATLADSTLSADARSGQIDRLIAGRRALVSKYPSDPRLPQWQADLAFNLLFLEAAQKALDLTVEFGVAEESQHQRLADIANEALRLVDDATAGLSDAILDLEEDEDFATHAAMQQRHRYLLQVEQRQRLPFLNASAIYFSTLSSGDDGAVDRWKQVVDTLTPLMGELVEPWLSRARSMVGASEVRLGRFNEARVQFNTVLGAAGADGASMLRSRFGSVDLIRQSEGRSAGAAALDQMAAMSEIKRDPFTFLLVCDQRFLDAVARSIDRVDGRPAFHRAKGDAAPQLVKEAVRVYQGYLDNDLLPLNATQRQEVVAGRWRVILPESIPLADLPPEMALAQAERMTTDPQRQVEAIALLEALLKTNGEDGQIAPRLMLALANVHARRGDTVRAATVWISISTRFPLSPQAPQAAERAAAILSSDVLEHPDSTELTALYEQALTLAVEKFPQTPTFDRWAYERGLLLAHQGRDADAAHNFELVGAASELHLDAGFQMVQAGWHTAQGEHATEERLRSLAAVIAAADRLTRLIDEALAARELSDARRTDLRYYRIAAQVRAAQARRERGEYDAALKRLEGLEEGEGVEDSLAAEIIDTRIAVLEALGRTEQIESDLKELAQRAPDRALGIITRIATQRLGEAQKLIDAGDEEGAAALARERIEPVSRLGWSIAQPLSKSGDSGLAAALCQAEALRLGGHDATALGIYEQVLVWRANSAEAMLGRSECLFALERLTDALPGYQRIAAAAEEDRGSNFWLAELRILQIFDQAQRNTERIYPRIQRLRLVDPQFGGVRFRKPFAVLEDRHAP